MKSKWVKITVLLCFAGIIGIGYKSGLFSQFFSIDEFVIFMRQAGPWLYVAYLAMYIIGGVFIFPGSILAVSGGILFGPYLGVLMCLIGAMLSATTNFILSRYYLHQFFVKRLSKRDFYKKITAKADTHGLEFVMLIRVTPGLAFSLKSYICGLMDIKTREYLLGSFFLILPSAIMYAFPAGEAVHGGISSATLVAMSMAAGVSLLVYILYKRSVKKSSAVEL